MYALIENNAVTKYPFNGTDLRLSRTDVSWPNGVLSDDLLAAYNVLSVAEVNIPAYDPFTQTVDEVLPVFANGRWERSYIVRAKTPEEIAASQMQQEQSVRAMRQTKLEESDWTQLPDTPADKALWATYRQELRDVTSQAGFPWDVQWPVAPA